MTEEIKRILKNTRRTIQFSPSRRYVELFNKEDIQNLLDYITNLQQENEFLKLNNPEQNMEHFRIVKENKRKIDNLRKENKKLKEQLQNKGIIKTCENCEWFGTCPHSYREYDYKSRCGKANKIITDFMCTEEYCSVDPVAIAENYMEIQKALNGSDENE